MFDLIVSTVRAKAASFCISSLTELMACNTVEWSRFPNRIPMLFRLSVVRDFIRNMATCRARATSFVPRPASKSLSSGTSKYCEIAWMTDSMPTRSSDLPVAMELLEGHHCGTFFKCGDIDDMAMALNRMASSADWGEMSHNALSTSSLFMVDSILKQWIGALKSQ